MRVVNIFTFTIQYDTREMVQVYFALKEYLRVIRDLPGERRKDLYLPTMMAYRKAEALLYPGKFSKKAMNELIKEYEEFFEDEQIQSIK